MSSDNEFINDNSLLSSMNTSDTTQGSNEPTLKGLTDAVFRIQTGIFSLHGNIIIAERLYNIQNTDTKKKDKPMPRVKSITDIEINETYLDKMKTDIELANYRLDTLLRDDQSTMDDMKQNDDYLEKHRHLISVRAEYIKLKDSYKILRKMYSTYKRDKDKSLSNSVNGSKIMDSSQNNKRLLYEVKIENIDKYGDIIKQGALTKLGNIRRNWKMRNFILTSDNILRYYDSKKRLLNEINVSTAKYVTIQGQNSNYYDKQKFKFTLRMKNREFIFACENERERKSWITHLQKIINNANNINNDNNDTYNINDFNSSIHSSKKALLMQLSKLEYKQLSTNNEIFADLQERLEDIADIKLLDDTKSLQITIISDTWIRRHTIVSKNEINWSTIIDEIRTFFDKSHGNIIKQGYLYKKMDWQGTWKKRYVVLKKHHQLEYYLTNNTDKQRGIIDLSKFVGIREITIQQYRQHNDPNIPDWIFEIEFIDIKNKRNKLKFGTKSNHELQCWMNDIQKYSKYIYNIDDNDPKPIKSKSNKSDKTRISIDLYTSDYDLEFRYHTPKKQCSDTMIDPIIV